MNSGMFLWAMDRRSLFATENLDGLRLEHFIARARPLCSLELSLHLSQPLFCGSDIAHWLLVVWNLGYLALCAIRYFLRAAYLRTATSLGSVSLWRSRFVVAQATGSVFWALAAILLFPTENHLKQGFLSLLVAGISVGTTHTCAADKRGSTCIYR